MKTTIFQAFFLLSVAFAALHFATASWEDGNPPPPPTPIEAFCSKPVSLLRHLSTDISKGTVSGDSAVSHLCCLINLAWYTNYRNSCYEPLVRQFGLMEKTFIEVGRQDLINIVATRSDKAKFGQHCRHRPSCNIGEQNQPLLP